MLSLFKTPTEKAKVKKACQISTEILSELKQLVVEGSSPSDINSKAGELCKSNNVKPSFLGVPGVKSKFPGNLCVSVNDETLHTIPFSKHTFQSGDIVKVDFGIIYEGIFTDHCVTIGVGKLTKDEERLISTTKLCIQTAVKQAFVGNRTGDISNVLETISSMAGFNQIRGYAGHGIGYSIHEDPSVPYVGNKGTGALLQEGMLICVETQLSLGSGRLVLDKDGWTLRTEDGAKTAMFEHMVLVGKEPLVLTKF